MNQNHEQIARDHIDLVLMENGGWFVGNFFGQVKRPRFNTKLTCQR